MGTNGSYGSRLGPADSQAAGDTSPKENAVERSARDTVRLALDLLTERGHVYELRALKVPETNGRDGAWTGYYDTDNLDALADDALNLDEREAKGVYITLNPVNPDLLSRSPNKIQRAKKGGTTSDADVVRRRRLLIDIDAERPSETSASDEEHEAARQTAEAIADELASDGWPRPVICDSGNGAHLLYRIDLPAADDGLVKRVLEGLAARFDGTPTMHGQTKIDRSVSNAARICKLPGTRARKGQHTEERPHRRSSVLEFPKTLEIVTQDQLEAVAAPQEKPGPSREGPKRHKFDLDAWMERHLPDANGPESWNEGGKRWVLPTCPFNPEHDQGEAYVVQQPSGEISAGCHHDSCKWWHWQDLRDHLEPGCYAGRSPAHVALAEWLEPRYAPVFREADPARITLWDVNEKRLFEVPLAPAKAREELSVHTGLVIGALLDEIAPLPPHPSSGTHQSWQGKQAAASNTLTDALTQLCKDIPMRPDLHELSRGVHIRDDQVVIVNGSTATWREGDAWHSSDTPRCPLGIVSYSDGRRAQEWYPNQLPVLEPERDSSLGKCIKALMMVVGTGWRFEEDWAAQLLALYAIYGIVHQIWPRRVHLHLMGPSSSGKSSLLDGFFAKLWPHGGFEPDPTEAGLAAKYANAAVPIWIDEAEGTRSSNLSKVYDSARRGTDATAVKLRGNQHGGYREAAFSWPLGVASIEPIATGEADANRFFVVTTKRETGHDSAHAIGLLLDEYGISTDGIRDAVWHAALSSISELIDVTKRLRGELVRPKGVDTRLIEGVLPLLAIAEVGETGQAQELLDTLTPALVERARYASGLSGEELLVEAILNETWRIEGEQPGAMGLHCTTRTLTVNRVIGEYLSPGGTSDGTAYATVGVVIERGEDGPELWLNLSSVRSHILVRTTHRDTPPEILKTHLARHPAFIGTKKTTRRGCSARWQRLSIATLLGTSTDDEAPDDE